MDGQPKASESSGPGRDRVPHLGRCDIRDGGRGCGLFVALAATVTVEPSVPAELKDQGCRLGNSVVPKAAGPAVATICDKREEVMKGFLMQGPERIAICCPIPTGK